MSRSEAGGKAVHLSELWHLGIPVPATWVIPVSTFRTLSRLNTPVNDPSAWTIPESMIQAWLAVAEEIGAPLAVRSSASNEDGHQFSFAGQYETVLNVGPDGLIAAIRQCWSSLNANPEYGDKSDRDGMAVVIQPMVDATVSGGHVYDESNERVVARNER